MVTRNGLIGSRKKKNMASENLDDYDFGDDGFMEGDAVPGKSISTFSFGTSTGSNINAKPIQQQPSLLKLNDVPSATVEAFNGAPRGLTPPIDGEHFTLKRGYQLRPSTARKLNELKTKHPDVNVYLNTILDAAILHYYNYIFNENGKF